MVIDVLDIDASDGLITGLDSIRNNHPLLEESYLQTIGMDGLRSELKSTKSPIRNLIEGNGHDLLTKTYTYRTLHSVIYVTHAMFYTDDMDLLLIVAFNDKEILSVFGMHEDLDLIVNTLSIYLSFSTFNIVMDMVNSKRILKSIA